MNNHNIPFTIPFIYIPNMSLSGNKRKGSNSTSGTTSTGDHSKKLLNTHCDSFSESSKKSKSSDEVEVLPNLSDRLSKLESELVEVRKELIHLKDTNKKMILEDDAYQMKEFWDRNRRGLEDYIAKRIAACKTCVLDCTRDFSGRIKKLEKQINAVWNKEEERTQRLDALIENEKK